MSKPLTETHYLVVDSDDDSILGWFPMTEEDARDQAERLARSTKHELATGEWTGSGFALRQRKVV